MNVLIHNRERETYHGGDLVQADCTIYALRDIGIEASYCSYPYQDLTGVDVVHIFHIGYEWAYAGYLNARLQGKPVVISCIYAGADRLWPVYQKEILDYASSIICLSELEANDIYHKHGKHFKKKTHIVPNGIDKFWFEPSKVDKTDVVMVGRVEIEKNQLYAIKACRNLDLPLTIAGEIRDVKYAERCNAEAYEKAVHVGKLDTMQLKSLYDRARVLILPSTIEIFPLCVMEGGANRCNVVLTRNSKMFLDYPNVFPCDPFDEHSITESLQKAWEMPINSWLKIKLERFTWENVAKQLKGIYENTCNR